MIPAFLERCPCCGLGILPQASGECPRCDYPLAADKEEQFLLTSLRDLQRVVQYGHNTISVAELIQRYQARLHYLRGAVAPPLQKQANTAPTESTHSPSPARVSAPTHITQAESQGQPQPQMFSLRSLLADQTINIVASLGAFLILVGSLSFVATTTSLLLSFLIIGITHIVFGVAGIVLRRFRNFRTVSTIYSAIFALLLPLVGFSAYRLVAQHLIPVSPPTLVAVAAAYATIIYSVLAVYQTFRLFGYLAVIALIVADLALAIALHMTIWWWPSMLMLLTMPALLFLSKKTRTDGPFSGSWTILQAPLRLLAIFCVGVCSIAICYSFYISTIFNFLDSSTQELRFSLLSMLLLLSCWLGLFVWRTGRVAWLAFAPYSFLACVLAFGYAFNFQMPGYVVELVGVALFYHVLDLCAGPALRASGNLRKHMETLALCLLALVPLLVLWITPLQIFTQELFGLTPTIDVRPTAETLVELAAMVVGLFLTISVTLRHTGISAIPGIPQRRWCWLLLLSGFMLIWTYSLALLLLHGTFVWGFLGLALILIALAVALRYYVSDLWANPLDVLALATIVLTLLLSMTQSTTTIISLSIFFAVFLYAIVIFQDRQYGLFLPIAFALIAVLMPDNSFWVLACAAPAIAIAAFALSRLVGKIWSIPLYIIALSTAIMMGFAAYSQNYVLSATWMLFLFALVIYLIGVAESERVLLWAAPVFATWSAYYSGQLGDLYRLPILALLCAAIGIGIGCIRFIRHTTPAKLVTYSLPFYATGAAAGVLTGVYGTLVDVNKPFYAAVCAILLVYALVAYAVLLFERRTRGHWIVIGFALWGTFLLPKTISCSIVALSCSTPIQATAWCFTAMALVTGALGLLAGRITKRTGIATGQTRFTWSWAWYSTALVTIVVGALWSYGWSYEANGLLPRNIELVMLTTFIALSCTIMLVERVPQVVIVSALLAAWTIARIPAPLWQLMIAYNALCILVFALRFAWFDVLVRTRSQVHEVLGLGGQAMVVLSIIVQGGLSADSGALAFVGAGSLLVLALLLCWHGMLQKQKTTQRYCYYGAGLLCSLAVSWLLAALRMTHLDWLALAPATYLIVIAPLVMREGEVTYRERIGQLCALLGATLLLLPALWISIHDNNLFPTLFLAGEALVLMLLGIATRVRVFVLGGTALVVVSAMRAIFLPSLGVPPSLALAVLGITLLITATSLSLARHRLQIAWSQWE